MPSGRANRGEATGRQIVELLFAGPQLMREQEMGPSLRSTRNGFTELASRERFLIGPYERLQEALAVEGYGPARTAPVAGSGD